MTYEETLKIMSVLKAAYPSFYRDMKRDDALAAVELWASMFADDDYGIVGAAVKALIASDEKGFPPVIGQVKARIRQITEPSPMTEMEAWALVSRAISNSTYNSEEEFERLPPEVQAVVHDPGQLRQWAMGSADDLETVVASNFQRSFRAKEKARKEYAALPHDVKRMMLRHGANAALPDGSDGLMRLFDGGESNDPVG